MLPITAAIRTDPTTCPTMVKSFSSRVRGETSDQEIAVVVENDQKSASTYRGQNGSSHSP